MFFFTSERCNQENDFMRKLDALSAENTIKKEKKRGMVRFFQPIRRKIQKTIFNDRVNDVR